MTEAAIRVDELSVRYKGGLFGDPVTALDRVSLAAAPGEIVALLGPNGSGKTTLLRVLAGVQGQDSGAATLLGKQPASKELRRRVGWQPDAPPPLSHLKAGDLLAWLGTLQGLPVAAAQAAADRWLARLGLSPHARRSARTFSAGMQRRLVLGTALLCDPEVLLLDEPTASLDPEGSLLVLEVLREAAARGTCVLLASHHLQEVEQICTRAVLLDRGRVRAEGTLDDLLGTGEQELIVRGLSAPGEAAVVAAARAHGGQVEHTRRRHEHLFALFRRLREAE